MAVCGMEGRTRVRGMRNSTKALMGFGFGIGCLCWFCLFGDRLQAQASMPDAIALNDEQGVVSAMARGDRPALLEVVAHPRNAFEQELARTALLRGEGRLEASSRQLQGCEKALPIEHPMRGLCSLLLAGNLFMQRRMDEWQAKLEWIRHSYYPLLARDNPGRQPSLLDAEGVDFLPDRSFPAIELQWQQAQGRIPYLDKTERRGFEARLPSLIMVQIKGRRYHALIDTGASFDTIDPGLAKALGLLPSISYRKLTDASGQVLSAPIGLLPELELGPVTVKNWPISITRMPVPMVIGLPLLRRLGVVTLTADAMSISRTSKAHCRQPLLMSTNIDGSVNHLLYPIKIDGKPLSALIDTGGGFEIMGIKSLLPGLQGKPELQAISYGGSSQWVDSYPMQAAVDLGDGARRLHFKAMDQTAAMAPYELGGELLLHHMLVMDFERHTVCIDPLPRP